MPIEPTACTIETAPSGTPFSATVHDRSHGPEMPGGAVKSPVAQGTGAPPSCEKVMTPLNVALPRLTTRGTTHRMKPTVAACGPVIWMVALKLSLKVAATPAAALTR